MSESYDPEIVFLPSAENQSKMFYDRIAETQPGPLQMPEYVVSGRERFSEVRDMLSGRTGDAEFRGYNGNEYEVAESVEDTDLGNYVQEHLSGEPRPEEEHLLVEGVGSFDLDLRDGDFFTGYVLTGRKHVPGELPKPMMTEVQVFADPRKDSSAVIKVQED